MEFENLHDAHGILEIGTLANGKCHILGNSRNRFLSLRCSPRGIVSKLRRFPGLPFRSHVLRSAPSPNSAPKYTPQPTYCNSPPPKSTTQISLYKHFLLLRANTPNFHPPKPSETLAHRP